MDIMLVTKIED